MSLDLDTRQRAMLQEMGVHVWLPAPAPELTVAAPVKSVPAPTAQASAAALASVQALKTTALDAIKKEAALTQSSSLAAPKAVKPQPVINALETPSPALAKGIEQMSWPALGDAISQCQACKLCTGRRAPVFEAANTKPDSSWHADWLVVGNPPDEHDEREGSPVFGEAGEAAQLLANMLKAVGVTRRAAAPPTGPTLPAHTAYVTQAAKCRPDPARNPSVQELLTCTQFLRREVALVQPKVILAMGQFAAQALLQDQLPSVSKTPYLQLRGKVYQFQGIPVIVTYYPTNLLRSPKDKGRAWADLCLAVQALKPER